MNQDLRHILKWLRDLPYSSSKPLEFFAFQD
jgi:hypothetical protein